MRSAYLVSYDIADDKRRNAVFKALMDNGEHLQYSVFICELSRLEQVRLRGELADAIHAKEDQVIFLRVGSMDSLERALECLGRSWEPLCRAQVV